MKIVLQHPLRESWSSMPVPKTTAVSCDDLTFVLDERTLPKKLVELIPTRATQFAPEEWRPFCVLARSMRSG